MRGSHGMNDHEHITSSLAHITCLDNSSTEDQELTNAWYQDCDEQILEEPHHLF